ncbi:carbon-phosphorus lyase complex subunit PhnI [Burkholderia cepacia]|uniref:carbon-phosphorus lyase complex subunit PhnI n=1 Tax=Burkholderia cepacia TaxID=292 RepID=UPI002AB63CBE|nr:carbon-phosphorus lyase complex subunit PhnI [Burkholderia cepacia]
MILTSIKGGETAISASRELVARRRRGDRHVAALSVVQIKEQLSLAVDRVMSEGSLYDATLAALAIKQAEGDLTEAVYLLRAFRTTLDRFGYASPLETSEMTVRRRISTTHKDVPGGQLLGPTYDYTHRILDFALMDEAVDGDLSDLPSEAPTESSVPVGATALSEECGVLTRRDLLEDLTQDPQAGVADITREPVAFPSTRDQRLQNLSRGDEGFLMGLCYSAMRGYGRNHPFIAELRYGDVTVEMTIPELDLAVGIGTVRVTECQTVNLTTGDGSAPPQYTRGYGLVLGHGERKAIAMAMLDRSLRAPELGEQVEFPSQDEEFVLSHSDSVAASGLVQHLKLPHYVDFQAQLQLLDQMRAEYAARRSQTGSPTDALVETHGEN